MIENMQESHINDVVKIHIEAFPDSFLTKLGRPFLTLLYNEFTRNQFGYVCWDEDEIAGFLAGIYSTADVFFKNFIKKHFFKLLFLLGKTFIYNPSVLSPIIWRANRLFRKKGMVYKKSVPVYDLLLHSDSLVANALTLAVSFEHRGKGIAKQLWGHLLHDLPSRNIEAILASVDSDNISTNNLYKKMGFKMVARIKRDYKIEECKWLFYMRGQCSVSDAGYVTWDDQSFCQEIN